MRIILVLFLVIIYSCKSQSKNDFLTKEKFDSLVTSSIDSLLRDDFFGAHNSEIVIPTKDTILTANNISIACFYKRFFATIDFYNSKTSFTIDAIGGGKIDSVGYLYKYDDDLSEQKLEGRYIAIFINNILYKVTLGNTFEQATLFLLNAKIKLLKCYIHFQGCG